MILEPKGKKIVDGLRSYYINVEKLCEFYQGHIGSFGVFFESGGSEGALFFDQSAFLGGGLRQKNKKTFDIQDPIERVAKASANTDFSVSVYQVDSEEVYYWASLFNTRPLYEELKSDFTDLRGLIKKMETEGLTGYIHVDFENEPAGTIFFRNGQIVHTACVIDEDLPDDISAGTNHNIAVLLAAAGKYSGGFNVREIPLSSNLESEITHDEEESSAPAKSSVSGEAGFNKEKVLGMVTELLNTFESAFKIKPQPRQEFSVALRKKFIEKAETYDFLDPFAGEFTYADGKVAYSGDADWKTLAKAITDVCFELAAELKLTDRLESQIKNWRTTYKSELTELGHVA